MKSSQDLIYQVITNDIRRAILRELIDNDLYPEDLSVIFELSPSAITKHLKILQNAGFISRHRQGKRILCRLKPQAHLLMKVDWSNRFLL